MTMAGGGTANGVRAETPALPSREGADGGEARTRARGAHAALRSGGLANPFRPAAQSTEHIQDELWLGEDMTQLRAGRAAAAQRAAEAAAERVRVTRSAAKRRATSESPERPVRRHRRSPPGRSPSAKAAAGPGRPQRAASAHIADYYANPWARRSTMTDAAEAAVPQTAPPTVRRIRPILAGSRPATPPTGAESRPQPIPTIRLRLSSATPPATPSRAPKPTPQATAVRRSWAALLAALPERSPFELPDELVELFPGLFKHPVTGAYMDEGELVMAVGCGGSHRPNGPFGVGNAGLGAAEDSNAIRGALWAANGQSALATVVNGPRAAAPVAPLAFFAAECGLNGSRTVPLCFKCGTGGGFPWTTTTLLQNDRATRFTGYAVDGHADAECLADSAPRPPDAPEIGRGYSARRLALHPARSDLIQCDFCLLWWHLDCLDPPLASRPVCLDERGPDVAELHVAEAGNNRVERRRNTALETLLRRLTDPLFYSADNDSSNYLETAALEAGAYHEDRRTTRAQQAAEAAWVGAAASRFVVWRRRWQCPCHAVPASLEASSGGVKRRAMGAWRWIEVEELLERLPADAPSTERHVHRLARGRWTRRAAAAYDDSPSPPIAHTLSSANDGRVQVVLDSNGKQDDEESEVKAVEWPTQALRDNARGAFEAHMHTCAGCRVSERRLQDDFVAQVLQRHQAPSEERAWSVEPEEIVTWLGAACRFAGEAERAQVLLRAQRQRPGHPWVSGVTVAQIDAASALHNLSRYSSDERLEAFLASRPAVRAEWEAFQALN